MTAAKEPTPPPRWAQRMNKTGRDVGHVVEPWRKLWPTKTAAALLVAAGGWLLDLHETIPWPW